jgi:hypothetical protein
MNLIHLCICCATYLRMSSIKLRYPRNVVDSLFVYTAFWQGKIEDSGHLLNLT